ncbi:zinc finger CCHC domain-containing protein 7-like isoform X1 [Artemia franciscana]
MDETNRNIMIAATASLLIAAAFKSTEAENLFCKKMDIDELDEFDLQEIEAALYAKIHHEIYEECSGPTGEASSTALSSSCVTESYTAEDNFVAVQSHTAGHFRSLEEDAIYIIEEGSKYSVQSKCISSSSKATTVILSDSDEDIVCISANESNKNIIHIDSDSDVSIIPTEVNKDKPSVMKTRTGVSSFYKKKDDDPLTSGERSFLRLHFGFEKDKTELAKNKKKKQHVVFESDSDEEIHMRDITNLDSDISLNIEGTLASEHTNILRKIDAIVNQSVFVEQQDGEGDRVPRSWTDDMKQFYNNTKDLCDIDMAIRQLPKDKELWKIDPADKYKDFRRNRYFNTYKGRCSNCNQVGHPFRECPDPIKPIICSMCGGVGHNRFQCQLALCLQCGTRTPKYQEMCSRCRHDLRIICCICKMQGHGPVRCPDVWRRYHLSTEPGHVSAPCTPPQRLIVRKTGCCNCASKHHSVSSCPSRRESVLPLHLNETIFSYENPFCYDSEIPTVFKRKIDDEQIKEVDKPRKVVGTQDCDIAPRCVHY